MGREGDVDWTKQTVSPYFYKEGSRTLNFGALKYKIATVVLRPLIDRGVFMGPNGPCCLA